tara:strand:- start:138 stop:398 length:261 start_codon:yes stop_codon:yes gene_type:complete
MKKELKYFFYIAVVFSFIIFTLNYYFSDINKKNFFRSFNNYDKKIITYSESLITLESDTNNIVEYMDNTLTKDNKKYKFWELLKND